MKTDRGMGGIANAGSRRMDTHQSVNRFVPRQPAAPAAKNGEHERWEIDARDSRLGFTLRHLVVSQIQGRFGRFGGTLILDRQQPWLSTVQVWIDVASLDTEEPERDQHIKSIEFLDVARFPRAEFTSTSVEALDGKLLLRGRLQLHGITHDVDLEVEAPTNGDVYVVRGRIDRRAYGLRWNQDLDVGGIVVGDEIEITAKVRVARLGVQ
jgi:polyisoprenoid-binding protein YceI